MSYLQCKACGGYYELQEGESPEDYDLCYCGGELEHHLSPHDVIKQSYTEEKEYKRQKNKKLLLIIMGCLILLVIISLALPLLIYQSYFNGPGLSPSDDIQTVRTMSMVVPLMGNYL